MISDLNTVAFFRGLNRLAGALILAGLPLLSLPLVGTAQIADPDAPTDPPPTSLWPAPESVEAILVVGDAGSGGEFAITFEPQPEVKQVVVATNYCPAPTTDDPHPTATRTIVQEFDTRYWPTTAAKVDTLRVAVAGKRPTGETVVELWEFLSPSLAQGGERIIPGARKAITTLYDERTDTRQLVQGLVRLRGASEPRLLVQFYDSKDLYSLRVSDGALTKVASPTNEPGVLWVPELAAREWSVYWEGRHLQHGYVYVFEVGRDVVGYAEDSPEESTDTKLILLDSNLDGAVDSAQELTPAEWRALGYADSRNWVDEE